VRAEPEAAGPHDRGARAGAGFRGVLVELVRVFAGREHVDAVVAPRHFRLGFRGFARTITALEHARTLKERRGERQQEVVVEQRPLAVYDELIA
jgi:hypothetical protein